MTPSAQGHSDDMVVITSHPPEGAAGFQSLWHRDIYREDNVVVSNVWQSTGSLNKSTHNSSDSQLSRRELQSHDGSSCVLINDQISSRSIKRSEEVKAGTMRI